MNMTKSASSPSASDRRAKYFIRTQSLGSGCLNEDETIVHYIPTPTKEKISPPPFPFGNDDGKDIKKMPISKTQTMSTTSSNESLNQYEREEEATKTISPPSILLDRESRDLWLGGEPCSLDPDLEWQGVQDILESLTAEERASLSDPCMPIRHFRAEKGHTSKAIESIKAALKWRKEFQVERLRDCLQPEKDDAEFEKMIRLEGSTGKMYVRGTTKEGRALLWMYAMKNNTHNDLNNMQYLVWNIEKAIAVTKRCSQRLREENEEDASSSSIQPLEKYCILIDCSNYKLSKAPSLQVSKFTLDILQKHYPERMHRAFILNAPLPFRVFWNLVKPFIDPITKEKIVFVSRDSPGLKLMHEMVDPSTLEASAFGTETVREFDPDEYFGLPMNVSFGE